MRRLLFHLARATPQFRGKFRIVRAVDALLRWFAPGSLEVATGGVAYRLDTCNLIEFWIAYAGGYQANLRRHLIELLQDGDVYWDVGANMGGILLPICHARPGVRGFGFEPSAKPMAAFLENLALNPGLAGRAIPVSIAVSAGAPSMQEFYVSREAFNTGVGGLEARGNRRDFPVKVFTLSPADLVAMGIPEPTVVKIDVEGHEATVLEGLLAMPSFAKLRVVVFEHHVYRQQESKVSVQRFAEMLKQRGFKIVALEGAGGLQDLGAETYARDCDLFAIRNGI